MGFLYRDILKRALATVWRSKFLWLLGLFAAILGNAGEYEVLFRNYDVVTDQVANAQNFREFLLGGGLDAVVDNVRQSLSTSPAFTVTLLIILLAVAVFVVWLSIISQGALVSAVGKAGTGRPSSLGESFAAGRTAAAPVFGINLFTRLVVWLLFLLVTLPIFFTIGRDVTAWQALFIILSFVILVPAVLALSFIAKYAIASIVLKKQRFGPSLASGWRLFRTHWLVSIEMALIMFAINFVVSLAMVVGIVLIAVPFILLAVIFVLAGSQGGLVFTITAGTLAVFLLLFLFGALLSAFQYAAWTNLYLKLLEGKAVSRLVRWGRAISGRTSAAKA